VKKPKSLRNPNVRRRTQMEKQKKKIKLRSKQNEDAPSKQLKKISQRNTMK